LTLHLDEEQLRILNWRVDGKDIGAVVGPPGCGRTTVGSGLAVKIIAEGLAKRALLVAYISAAANEFGWELYNILGPAAEKMCIRTGNPTGIDPLLPITFRSADRLLEKRIIISTNLSLKKLPPIRFDNMIIDEAGVERLEHLLWPFWFGVNREVQNEHREKAASEIDDLMELISRCGAVATVVGNPKQSRPISPVRTDY
jgi:hypothetical protein